MKPAISLAAVPGRRAATIELAQELDRRGYAGIYLPSFGDAMGLATAIALKGTALFQLGARAAGARCAMMTVGNVEEWNGFFESHLDQMNRRRVTDSP